MTTTTVTPLRDPSAPIASQVDVTAGRMSGEWVVIAAFRDAPAGPGLGDGFELRPVPGGLRAEIIGGDCGVEACFETSTLVPLQPAGPGRWTTPGGGWLPSGPLWVLWMDADARTAVIGRPDGAAAWIMDRTSAGSPDRLAAGRDILEWFGYDLSRLEEVPR